MAAQYVRSLASLTSDDLQLVGGKNAALGELFHALHGKDVHLANGFAVTADAYRALIEENDLASKIRSAMAMTGAKDLATSAERCRDLIRNAKWPEGLEQQVIDAYIELTRGLGSECGVAVRSSATAEDLPDASFAGQHDSFLNVYGPDAMIDACRDCFASLFTDRAVRYREIHGFDHLQVALSVGVMTMVHADEGASGVVFTLDTESGCRDVVLIHATYGVGETLVQGLVDPDEFLVHKPTFRRGHRAVVRHRRGAKQVKRAFDGSTAWDVVTTQDERDRFALTDPEIYTLVDAALAIEGHFSEKAGHDVPMDIEWAKDGENGLLYIVQARPETVASQEPQNAYVQYRRIDRADSICDGRAVGLNVATGRVCVVESLANLGEFRPGDVLVADTTSPDWGAVMRSAAAVVTNRGGRTCHAAIVARELGIPAVVGCGDATSVLTEGEHVTVSCAEGEVGFIYRGDIAFESTAIELGDIPKTKTELMLNMADPDLAFQLARLPSDGVGLVRTEFVIGEQIGMHPMALAHPERVVDPATRAAIEARTRGYASPAEFFICQLAEGLATIAAAFYPRPVIARLSDFKSNEYARLLGGSDFELQEDNPMLGFRGAARYTHPAYADGFALECAAFVRARAMGLPNIKVMVPFCRRVQEARDVLATLADHGLQRGRDQLEIYVMCEIPNNVIQIDSFAQLFDGFSIGSNDLTQLTLGVDRDSEIVAFDFDERDAGVLALIDQTVAGAKRNGKACGICGQAPSDFPEVAEHLVKIGIDSMSLSPDSLIATRLHVREIESGLEFNDTQSAL